jgi:hypothetical protein
MIMRLRQASINFEEINKLDGPLPRGQTETGNAYG